MWIWPQAALDPIDFTASQRHFPSEAQCSRQSYSAKRSFAPYESRCSAKIRTMTTYICPMHSEVSEEAPGTCPDCGMALEPDAPVMARAHIGIAMGSGTDIAMESAGVTLLKGDLSGLVRARRLSPSCDEKYPLFGVLLSPMIAAAAMSLSSLSVIANALRLNRITL